MSLNVPPVHTAESFRILAAVVLLWSTSTKEADPVAVKDTAPTVMPAVTTTGVTTGPSLVPTMVTVTVEVSVPPA